MHVSPPEKEATKAFTARPGYASEIAIRIDHLLSLLDRVDTQIDELNQALNACQPPANGKLGIYRDKPVHVGIAGYPRLVSWRRTQAKTWVKKNIGNASLGRRARSRGTLGKSYRIVTAILREFDKLLKKREAIIDKLSNFMRFLATVDVMEQRLEEHEIIISSFRRDAMIMLKSAWITTDEDLEY